MKPRPRGLVAQGWDGVEGTPHDRALVTRVRGHGLYQENHKVRRETESRAAPQVHLPAPQDIRPLQSGYSDGGRGREQGEGADIMGTIPRATMWALYQPL